MQCVNNLKWQFVNECVGVVRDVLQFSFQYIILIKDDILLRGLCSIYSTILRNYCEWHQ